MVWNTTSSEKSGVEEAVVVLNMWEVPVSEASRPPAGLECKSSNTPGKDQKIAMKIPSLILKHHQGIRKVREKVFSQVCVRYNTKKKFAFTCKISSKLSSISRTIKELGCVEKNIAKKVSSEKSWAELGHYRAREYPQWILKSLPFLPSVHSLSTSYRVQFFLIWLERSSPTVLGWSSYSLGLSS